MSLKDYLASISEKPYKWARRHGLSKDPVYRAFNGKPVGYQSACRISDAAGGEVSIAEIMQVSLLAPATTEGKSP